jgi:hypothetical protein
MGFLDRFRRDPEPETETANDERAIERYRYMLATAPPEDIERAHEEAFAQLSPEQRRAVLDQLARHVPPGEARGDDPASLARTATRAEMRQPGTMERAFGGGFAAPGLGSYFLTVLAASFIGTAIAQSFFANDAGAGGDAGDGDGNADSDGGAATADADGGADGDFGGDFGGEVGGGDFGGGDLGGGDFGDF